MTGLDPNLTHQELLQELESRAKARWGQERLAALQPTLNLAADALWLLRQQHLSPSDEVPDFLSDIAPPNA